MNFFEVPAKITKGNDAAPVAPFPSAYCCCFVCRFSQFTMTGGAPVPPATALLFQSYASALAMYVPAILARAGSRNWCVSMKAYKYDED